MKSGKAAGLFLILAGFLCLWLLRDASPLLKLAAASIGMIWIIKLAALLWQMADGTLLRSPMGTLAFIFAWPGTSLSGFTERGKEPPAQTGARFLEAWLSMLAGTVLLVAVSLLGNGQSTALNYMALFSIPLIVHLGLVEVLADGLRLLGFSPPSLFDRPYLSSSLRDFWSSRWNRAFVDMNKIFLLTPFRDRVPAGLLVFSIFAVSGLLHELGISFPDGTSWGLPLLYFLIQGIGMALEKKWKLPLALVWFIIVLPLPLLFTPAFTNLFLGALSEFIYETATGFPLNEAARGGLQLGGALHLLVLCASVQVPGKLGWQNEFQKLLPLNRKIFWTYGGYIFSIILFMSLVSFVLAKSEPLNSGAALLWLCFIATFWWARVLTDFFYFSHHDWPKGPLFTVGHICLTTLFISLALLYTAIALLASGWIL